ncbi:MAG: hypothetical protein KAS63_06535 [Candidatus Heimdallarchaeota archaeon]|nr:hypothetical protein [Candidatus Heimdallarchaeota archaeon]MCK4955000.1 hypothetical protein [Candidatus Heimdallarchaeota archaeon]
MFELSDLSETTFEKVRNLSQDELFNFTIYLLRVGINFSHEFGRLPFNDEELFNMWLVQSKKLERFKDTEQELAFPIHISPKMVRFADLSEDTVNKIRELPCHVSKRILVGFVRRVLPIINVPEDIYMDYLIEEYSV